MSKKKSVGSISATDYIAWVQRSLNRILAVGLITDGSDTSRYREAINEFQWAYGLSLTSDIDWMDQDALIRANHLTPEYVKWIQKALVRVGAGIGLAPTGSLNKTTTNAIKSFQAYMGLMDDGWVGAKSETALIREGGIQPPGGIARGSRPPKVPRTKPPGRRATDPLPIEKRVDRVLGSLLYEAIHSPSTYKSAKLRKRVKCLAYKLKKRSGVDMKFITVGDAHRFVHRVKSPRYSMLDKMADNARDVLRKYILKLDPADRTDQDKIRDKFLELDDDIQLGLGEIEKWYGIHGTPTDPRPWKKPVLGPADMLHKWAYDRQNGKTPADSILACYEE